MGGVLCCHAWQMLHGACNLFRLWASRQAAEVEVRAEITCKAHAVHADSMYSGLNQCGLSAWMPAVRRLLLVVEEH